MDRLLIENLGVSNLDSARVVAAPISEEDIDLLDKLGNLKLPEDREVRRITYGYYFTRATGVLLSNSL